MGFFADTVNCVTFTPDGSHLFTCSNDGTIAAIRCGNWQIEKHWQKAHKGSAVNTLAIHPTGKIALSAGADGILRTWNLVKGRQAYATNLTPRLKLDAKNVTVLKWSPNGEKYLLAVNQRIDIYSVEMAGIDDEIQFNSKIVCVEFLKDNLIAVGLENGQIKFYDLEKSVHTVEAIAHDIRVKCMAFMDDLLVTASSLGEIKLWKYTRNTIDILQSVNSGTRITSITIAKTVKNLAKSEKMKLEKEEQETAKDEEELKKKNRFRLRREVIIEDEGDWEVKSINPTKTKVSGRKAEKKRTLAESVNLETVNIKKNKTAFTPNSKSKSKREWTIEDTTFNDNIPKKKKKKKSRQTENEVLGKKRKEITDEVSQESLKSQKKIKKSNAENLTHNILPQKTKIAMANDDSEVYDSSGKKRKIAALEDGIIIKKKKKKQRQDKQPV